MTFIDWGVLGCYVLVVIAIGTWTGRKNKGGSDEMFLAGRSIPTWAAMLSFVATIQSAATFVAGPEMVFRNDLRHLMRITGSITGAFIVAYWVLPALYQSGKTTVYGLLETRFGPAARMGASALFVGGVLLSAGARLLIAGIAFATILFGEMHFQTVVMTIVIAGIVGTIYTVSGGMRAVIWTDVAQSLTYLLAAFGCLATLLWLIPVPWDEAWQILETGGTTGRSKLHLFDWQWSWSSDDTFWASLIGLAVFHVGSFGTQQDITQRLLACRSSREAQKALLRGIGLIFASSWLFAMIGLALFVFYQAEGLEVSDSRKVYPEFIVKYLPTGLRGLVATGIFAAAMSSLDSAMNSIANCVMSDFHGVAGEKQRSAASSWRRYRWTAALSGGLLTLSACGLGAIQLRGNRELFDFAVMASFYGISGMLGVFLAALFTRRGNHVSAILGLFAGAGGVGFCALLPTVTDAVFGQPWELGFPFWIVVGVASSFTVCVTGSTSVPGTLTPPLKP